MLKIEQFHIFDSNSPQLRNFLKEQSKKVPCLVIDSCSSTFNVLKSLLHNGLQLCNASSVFAHEQKFGRGQYDSSWYSPRGGLYASALLQKNTFSEELNQLASLVLGVATVKVLRDFGEQVFLKWPNDIVKKSEQKWCKAGGMLLQSQTDWLFWGLGLNLQSFKGQNFTKSLEPIELSINLEPLDLWLKVWSAVWLLLKEWHTFNSREIFIKRYIEPLLAFKNEEVVFMRDGRHYCGVFRGLNAQGAALLNCQGQQITLYSGSLRPYRSSPR